MKKTLVLLFAVAFCLLATACASGSASGGSSDGSGTAIAPSDSATPVLADRSAPPRLSAENGNSSEQDAEPEPETDEDLNEDEPAEKPRVWYLGAPVVVFGMLMTGLILLGVVIL